MEIEHLPEATGDEERCDCADPSPGFPGRCGTCGGKLRPWDDDPRTILDAQLDLGARFGTIGGYRIRIVPAADGFKAWHEGGGESAWGGTTKDAVEKLRERSGIEGRY